MTFPEPRAWQLVVKDLEDLTPRMRRIRLSAPSLDRFSFLPGQDISLAFTARDGSTVRRRYSIRTFDQGARTLDINIVMHGDGPGMRWAQAARPGTDIEAIGPRGKITLAMDADWHLFAGDATAIPAAFAMMDALPNDVPAFGLFEIDDEAERQRVEDNGRPRVIDWRYTADRSGVVGGLLEAVIAARVPGGRGHAYLAGEVGLVSSLKSGLLASGWLTEQISAKAYWNRGRPNAGHGEPEQKVA